MTEKNVRASGAGSIAIGGSVKGSKLAANVETRGAPPPSQAEKAPTGQTTVASGVGAIAVGGHFSNSTAVANVKLGDGAAARPGNSPVEFPPLQVPVDLILRIARVGGEEIRFDARSKDGRQVGPFTKRIGRTDDFAARLSKIQRRQNEADDVVARELSALGLEIAGVIPKELIDGEHALLGQTLQKRSPSILILTDETYIPWELALLSAAAAPTGKRYLGEIAEVGRWPINDHQQTPRANLDINNIQAFAAESYSGSKTRQDLPEALNERKFLVDNFQAVSRDATRPAIDAWLGAAQKGDETVHMALHGYSDPRANDQNLVLGDGQLLTPNDLLGVRADGKPRAYSLVFLNACQSGTAGQTLGQAAGFPGVLARHGAGAIIAPLWEVKDHEARAFAEGFIRKL